MNLVFEVERSFQVVIVVDVVGVVRGRIDQKTSAAVAQLRQRSLAVESSHVTIAQCVYARDLNNLLPSITQHPGYDDCLKHTSTVGWT